MTRSVRDEKFEANVQDVDWMTYALSPGNKSEPRRKLFAEL